MRVIKLNDIMIEDIVKMLNPRYIGFLLNLYNPFFFNRVFFEGIPKLVEFPKLIKLSIVKISPTKNRK